MAEQPSLTTAQQMYETERLAAENKRLKRTIDERLNELKAIRQRNENLTESFQENLYLKVLLGMVCLSVLLCIALISFLLHL
jgi:cell shape-determining protein MreC